MNKERINILVFGHTPFGIRRLRIKKETLRMAAYLFVFFQFSITFFLCDYVQVRKKTFLLSRLRQESQIQKSYINLFSTKIGELEKKLSHLKEIDQKIRVIANLERGQEALPFIGMGGASSSVTRPKSAVPVNPTEARRAEKPRPRIEEPNTEETKQQEPKESASATQGDEVPLSGGFPLEATTPSELQ